MKHTSAFLIFLFVAFLLIRGFIGGIVAGGESYLYVNPNYLNFFYSWEDKFNFGQASGNQNNFVLFGIFWRLLERIPTIHPSVIFIFLSFFLSSVAFYILCISLFGKKNVFLYIPGALLYSFNTFRLLGPLNERQNLLFVSLPIFILLYWKICESRRWIHIFLLGLLSIATSSMGGNLPVFIIPYLLLFFMFVYYLGIYLKFRSEKIINFVAKNISLAFIIISINLFWLVPLYVGLVAQSKSLFAGSNNFIITASGYFLDHFRFIGSWAWRNGHAGAEYYPSYTVFDSPLFLVLTLEIPLLALSGLVFLDRVVDQSRRRLLTFTAIIIPVSLLLLAGGKGPLGFIFNHLYNETFFFRIFREPFAKFTPMFIIALCIFLTFVLQIIFSKAKPLWRYIIFILVTVTILINAYPFFVGQAIPVKKWIGGRGGNLIKIPEYWSDAKQFLEKDHSDRRLTLLPYMPYGGIHLWPDGVGTVGNMADYLLRNRILKGWDIDNTMSGQVVKSTITSSSTKNLSRTIGLMNSKYVLQMNDFDWRYGTRFTFDQKTSNKFLTDSGLMLVQSFGQFTKDDISKILSEEKTDAPDTRLGQLVGEPALKVYKINDEDYFPHLYLSSDIFISEGEPASLSALVGSMNKETNPLVIFSSQNEGKDLNGLCRNNCVSKNSVLEYRKFNPTQYRAIVHNPESKPLSLVFSETFDSGWKAYVTCVDKTNDNKSIQHAASLEGYRTFSGSDDQAKVSELTSLFERGLVSTLGDGKTKKYLHYGIKNQKEEVFSTSDYSVAYISRLIRGTIQNDNLAKPQVSVNKSTMSVDEVNHLVANGYANSWIIDPSKYCSPGQDLDIYIHILLQKKQNWLFFFSAILTLGLTIGTLFLLIKKRLTSND